MKSVLSFGLDSSALEESSALSGRLKDLGKITSRYDLIVPSKEDKGISLAENVHVFGVQKKGKISTLFNLYKKGRVLLEQNKYSMITVQDIYYVAWVAYCLAHSFNLPLQIQIHGFEKYGGLRKLLARHLVKKAQNVRTVSERLKKEIVKKFGIPEDKIIVVPIYAEQKPFVTDVVLQTGKQEGEFIFLLVARLVPVKNIELALQAIAEVVKDFPNARLWIVGDGDERQRLVSRSAEFGLEKTVEFKGYQKDMQPFYNNADVLLITSDSEGWGMVAVEAARYALPVIMTDVGLAGEFILHNHNGLVVPVGDIAALVYAMKNIIDEPELRKTLGQNNKAALQQLPDRAKTLELYMQSFEATTFR